MLARRSKLRLPGGSQIDLPLLVPSFSSKGFPTFGEKVKGKLVKRSEANLALNLIGEFLGSSTLISAYDIRHDFLVKPTAYFKDREVVLIDSGGYELAPDFDSTEPSQGDFTRLPFELTDYEAVLKKLPKAAPLLIANYDWGTRQKPLAHQLEQGRELFHGHPHWISNFIVKPTTKDRRHLDIPELRAHVKEFRDFSVLGVTEKELGGDLLERLKNLAAIRAEMDRQGVTIPIHVWGGLDPLITPLYFFAGAEIFDGVSWLRYAYHEGTAVYRDCYGLLTSGIDTNLSQARALAIQNNLVALRKLTTSFQRFVDSGGKNFSVFEWHADKFKAAYEVMRSKIPDLKGGA
jgi:hypothetical protein